MSIDFQAALDEFSGSGNNSDPISAIYDIIPTFTLQQQKLIFVVRYFIAKYDLDDVDALLNEMIKTYNKNKNINMLQQRSLSMLLSAYTQNEMIRGIKVNAYNNNDSGTGGGAA